MLCNLSKLDEGELDEITRLERELGRPLLAFSCYSAEPARLSGDELAKVEELETRLGISLVAVEK